MPTVAVNNNKNYNNVLLLKRTLRNIIRRHRKKRYSPTRVKLINFLTNISYNRLKHEDFDSASFVTDCFTLLLFNLNPFFLEQKYAAAYDMVCAKMLWTFLIPSEFYFAICRNDNFMVLNKLTLKYQEAYTIVNNVITADNKHFPKLKEYFIKNALVY